MKITLTNDGKTEKAELPYDGAPHVLVKSACACGSHTVHGTGNHQENHDTYRADAVCAKCDKPRGTLRTKVDTLFGIEEDELVLNGRWRVY